MPLRRAVIAAFVAFAAHAAPALAANTVTVDVGGTGLTFNQPQVTINPGDTIHWVWQGVHHSVTSGALAPNANGTFDSGVQNSLGATFDQTFTHPGVYHYFCQIHWALGMVGTIVVSGAAPAPTAAFTPSTLTPSIGQSVSFNASAATAPAGYRLDTYSWDFGDGTTQTTTSPTTSHTYQTAGTNTVSLTVTTDASAVSVPVTQTETVMASSPTPPPPPPPPPPPGNTTPKLTRAHLSAAALCAKHTSHCRRTSATVSFTLSEQATVTVVIERKGKRVKRRVIAGRRGRNSLTLSARGLRAGRYTLVLTPKGGAVARLGFTIRSR
jgi:plastocyanin